MCGRFTLAARPQQLLEEFPDFQFPSDLAPRYNIAPAQRVLVLPGDGSHRAQYLRWGLVPSWAGDPSVGSRMINARAETVLQKPAFRSAFRKRRCLVPADGFYEWQGVAGRKQPFHLTVAGGGPFAMAGLWEVWSPAGSDPLRSFAILTTEANQDVRPLHDRMPLILPPEARQVWLDPDSSPDDLQGLLVPFAGMLDLRAVSTYVNQAGHEGPDCLAPQAG